MFEWIDKVGRLNHVGQRLLHRVSVRSQLASEEGRHLVRETVEEGREVIQNAASSLLHTLEKPVAWTDDVLNHKVGVLGWTRERLSGLAQELEPKQGEEQVRAERSEGGDSRNVGAKSVEWPQSGERRAFDRRQFSRAGSGRRMVDQALKNEAELVSPRPVFTPTVDASAIETSPVAMTTAQDDTRTDILLSADGSPTVVTTSSETELPGQEPISASVAEIIASHQPSRQPRMPIKNYDTLNVHKILAALRKVDIKEIPELLVYEKTHKNRRSVLDAMQRILVHGRPAVA